MRGPQNINMRAFLIYPSMNCDFFYIVISMDSLTQITLGAAIGAAILGKTHGRKGALIGAICGTIPDLDVFYDYGDDVSNFTMHRGLTHSFLFCILATPLFAWVFLKIKWFGGDFKDKRVHIAIFSIFLTHILLDAMTIYGTQLFWPLTVPPVGVGSVFIIDPLYTLPFLFFLIWFLVNKSHKAIMAGIIISTLYLGWSVVAQWHVTQIARPQIEGQMLVQPTPFNTILWRVLVMQDDGYQVGYYSLFDNTKEIKFGKFESDPDLLSETASVNRLKWFTKGFYSATNEGDDIVMSDLRMGLEPDQYVFRYIVNEDPAIMAESNRDMSRLNDIWDRVFRDL
jgi:inner membrane protein